MFHWLQLAVAALALLGVAYYLLCLWSAASFLLARRRSRAVNGEAAFTPAVTILKPVLGADPGAYESFRSHCLQDYPEYARMIRDHYATAAVGFQHEFDLVW